MRPIYKLEKKENRRPKYKAGKWWMTLACGDRAHANSIHNRKRKTHRNKHHLTKRHAWRMDGAGKRANCLQPAALNNFTQICKELLCMPTDCNFWLACMRKTLNDFSRLNIEFRWKQGKALICFLWVRFIWPVLHTSWALLTPNYPDANSQ